jgi:uncharacterized DUF497 family protein
MENVEFEWDDEKAKINFDKHGVNFDEGATIFNDPFVLMMPDPDHSISEERYISLGMSVQGRLLIVSYTERGNRNRLISCRKATNVERKIYEKY